MSQPGGMPPAGKQSDGGERYSMCWRRSIAILSVIAIGGLVAGPVLGLYGVLSPAGTVAVATIPVGVAAAVSVLYAGWVGRTAS